TSKAQGLPAPGPFRVVPKESPMSKKQASRTTSTRVALYCRVSTTDQTRENRPGLDALMADARRRKFDLIVVAALDRLGRNLRHLVTLLDELQHLGIGLVSLREA